MDLLELAALPLVERLDHLDDVCRRLDCGVPAETSVSVAQLRELRKALKARHQSGDGNVLCAAKMTKE